MTLGTDIADAEKEAAPDRDPLAEKDTARPPPAPEIDTIEGEKAYLPGVLPVVSLSTAQSRKWQLEAAAPRGRDGDYVIARPVGINVFRFLVIPSMAESFYGNSRAVDILTKKENVTPLAKDFQADSPNSSLVFPELDRILARAQPNALQFCLTVANSSWISSKVYSGGIGEQMERALAFGKEKGVWDSIDTNVRAIHTVDLLLTCVVGANNRDKCTLWIGCPTIPDQLLGIIQKHVRESEPEWTPPPPTATMSLTERMDSVARHVRLIYAQVRANPKPSLTTIQGAIDAYNDLEDETAAHPMCTWDWLLKTTDLGELPGQVKVLTKHAKSMTSELLQSKPQTGMTAESLQASALLAAQLQSISRAEYGPDRPRLSPSDEQLLASAIQAGGTKSITLENVHLLVHATGAEMNRIQPAGPDLSPLATSDALKAHIAAVRQELCAHFSLFNFSEAGLLRLATLRLDPSSCFFLELFGCLVERSTDLSPRQRRPFGKIHHAVEAARPDTWIEYGSVEDIDTSIDGFCLAASKLLHPTVLDTRDFRAAWMDLKYLYYHNGGHVDPYLFGDAIRLRLSEHSRTLAARAKSSEVVVPSIATWGPISVQAKKRAENDAAAKLTNALQSCARQLGETTYGKKRPLPAGTDSDGRSKKYNRESGAGFRNAYTGRGLSSGPGPRGGDHAGGTTPSRQPANPGTGGFSGPCLRCGARGHRYMTCRKGWIPIPDTWSPKEQQLAADARRRADVRVVYARDIGPGRPVVTVP